MAEDVTPKILEDLQERIRENTAEKRQEARLIVKAEKGQAGFQDALEYAKLRGQDVGNAVREIAPSVLPNGEMYYNIAERTVGTVLREMSEDVLRVAADVVEGVNQKAGIGIMAQIPDETEKIHGIVDACTSRLWEEAREEVATACETFSRKCVDDTVRENAKFQYDSGMDPKVIRTAAAGACTWCAEVSGTYDYNEVRGAGDDVWRRHANCNCIVEFQPVKGRRQLVSSGSYRQNRDSLSPEERESYASVKTGGKILESGAKRGPGWEERHAELYYEEIRNRKPYSDANLIVQNVSGFSAEDIEQIRQHVFINEIERDGRLERFNADFDQAQVWQRLTEGKRMWDSDVLFLEHERMELTIMKETGCSYEDAHEQTTKVFDWWKAHEEEKKKR